MDHELRTYLRSIFKGVQITKAPAKYATQATLNIRVIYLWVAGMSQSSILDCSLRAVILITSNMISHAKTADASGTSHCSLFILSNKILFIYINMELNKDIYIWGKFIYIIYIHKYMYIYTALMPSK